jgi:NADH-ubiquinone oxidoreductase chain 4
VLKFLIIILFLIPLVYRKNSWHLVHAGVYSISFLFILSGVTPAMISCVRGYFGCDVLSYGLILLRF